MNEALVPGSRHGSVIVVRTHYVDDYLLALATSLSEGGRYEVLFAVDERERTVDTKPFDKVSLTVETVRSFGLNADEAEVFWKCGDYVVYMARHARPDAPYIWIIENDVFINTAQPIELFLKYDQVSQDDFLTSHFEVSDENWYWWKTLKDRFPTVYRCFFPLVRFSARAADVLLQQRQRDYADKVVPLPNDEAFAATILRASGFSVADFNQYGTIYDPQTFNAWIVINRHSIGAADDRIYHSARTGRSFGQALRHKSSDDPVTLLRHLKRDPELAFAHIEDLFIDRMTEELKDAADDPDIVLQGDTPVGLVLAGDVDPGLVGALMVALARRRMPRCIDALRQGWQHVAAPYDGRVWNVALGKPAAQSSTSSWSHEQDAVTDAQLANNGAKDVFYGCHTDQEEHVWWQVDLLAPYPVREVRIFNRHDTPRRLDGFRIQVSATGVNWTTVFEHDADEGARTEEFVVLSRPVTARYVRLALRQVGLITVREVEVFAHRPDSA